MAPTDGTVFEKPAGAGKEDGFGADIIENPGGPELPGTV